MNIKKVDDKPMVIHTKEKTRLHVKAAPETKLKGRNVLTVDRSPKTAGKRKEGGADQSDQKKAAMKIRTKGDSVRTADKGKSPPARICVAKTVLLPISVLPPEMAKLRQGRL